MIEDRPGLLVNGPCLPKEVGHGSLGGIYKGIQRLWCVEQQHWYAASTKRSKELCDSVSSVTQENPDRVHNEKRCTEGRVKQRCWE